MSEDKSENRGFLKRIFKRGRPEIREEKEKSAAAQETYRAESVDVEAELTAEKPEEKEKADLVRLEKGLEKTRSSFLKNLNRIFVGRRELDKDISAQLEEILVRSDIGVKTTFQLLESVTETMKRRELHDPQSVVTYLKSLITGILVAVEEPLRIRAGLKPFVVMMIGVNGSGKTTTIAKIAAQHKNKGKSVLLAAADTFRAAAVEQLEIWGARVGCPVVKGKEKADPSSVVFEAVDRAMKENIDIVLVDTAGRLHTRVPLMEELKKLRRTLAKKIPDAPHETLLVIDASTGQNAILQAITFNEAIPVTGIALTKLDGTAKGGVIVGISNELKIPIRYIGIGEKMEDLREFSAGHFVEALFTTAD
jgi:fused signal recognition particle receptor